MSIRYGEINHDPGRYATIVIRCRIAASAAEQGVVTLTTGQKVIAFTSIQMVVAIAPLHGVMTIATNQRIAAITGL